MKSPSIISVLTSISVNDFVCLGRGLVDESLDSGAGVAECLLFLNSFPSIFSMGFVPVLNESAVVFSSEAFSSVQDLTDFFSVKQFFSESDIAKIPSDTLSIADCTCVGDMIDPFDFIFRCELTRVKQNLFISS